MARWGMSMLKAEGGTVDPHSLLKAEGGTVDPHSLLKLTLRFFRAAGGGKAVRGSSSPLEPLATAAALPSALKLDRLFELPLLSSAWLVPSVSRAGGDAVWGTALQTNTLLEMPFATANRPSALHAMPFMLFASQPTHHRHTNKRK
jgi:hypothetical protein